MLQIEGTLLGSQGGILKLTGPSTEQNHTLAIGNPADTSAGVLNFDISQSVVDVNLFGASIVSIDPGVVEAPLLNGVFGSYDYLTGALADPPTVVGGLLGGTLPTTPLLAPVVNSGNINILNLADGNSIHLSNILPTGHG